MRAGYTNISVGHEVRTAVVQYQSRVIGALEKRVTQSEALTIALHLASQHSFEEIQAAALTLGIVEPPTESIGATSDDDE